MKRTIGAVGLLLSMLWGMSGGMAQATDWKVRAAGRVESTTGGITLPSHTNAGMPAAGDARTLRWQADDGDGFVRGPVFDTSYGKDVSLTANAVPVDFYCPSAAAHTARTCLDDAVSTLGSTNLHTILIPDPQTISANLTITSNLTLVFQGSGRLDPDVGTTTTINGPIVAPLRQIFGGSGTVVFGPSYVGVAIPQWWGATGDGTTNDYAALNSAVNSRANSVYLPSIKSPSQTHLALTGTTTANAATTIVGVNTIFLEELRVGDTIALSSASSTYGVVTAIASNTSLTVDTALGNGTSQTINTKIYAYSYDTTLNIPKNINFYGDGLGSTLRYTGIGSAIKLDPGTGNVTNYYSRLSNFRLYSTTGDIGIHLKDVGRVNIEDVIIQGNGTKFATAGIGLEATSVTGAAMIINIRGCDIQTNQIAIKTIGANAHNQVNIFENHIQGNQAAGIWLLQVVKGYNIIGNEIEGNTGNQILVQSGADGLTIIGNYFETNVATDNAITLQGAGQYTGVEISGNFATNNAGSATGRFLYMPGTFAGDAYVGMRVNANSIAGFGTATNPAIDFVSKSYKNSDFSGNYFASGVTPYGNLPAVSSTGVVLGDGEWKLSSGTKVGIGTLTVPVGSVGASLIAIHGTDNSTSAGPHVQVTTAADNYPLMQNLNMQHDNIAISMDAYYDGAWKSSDLGSNFQIYKLGDELKIRYANGVAAGSVITWNEHIRMGATGNLGFYGVTPVARPSAYTQTYSTADKTHAAFTSADLATTSSTQTTPWGFATQAQADNIATQFNALRVDVTDLKQLVNSIIDDLQSLGLAQ